MANEKVKTDHGETVLMVFKKVQTNYIVDSYNVNGDHTDRLTIPPKEHEFFSETPLLVSFRALQRAFEDGVMAGISSQDGTFGTEDFVGGPAAFKADEFIKREGGWLDLWNYCGGFDVLADVVDIDEPQPAKKKKADRPKGERPDRKTKGARAGK